MAMDDTYFVTNQQLLKWMQDPKTLDQLKNRATAGAFTCSEDKVIKKKNPGRIIRLWFGGCEKKGVSLCYSEK